MTFEMQLFSSCKFNDVVLITLVFFRPQLHNSLFVPSAGFFLYNFPFEFNSSLIISLFQDNKPECWQVNFISYNQLLLKLIFSSCNFEAFELIILAFLYNNSTVFICSISQFFKFFFSITFRSPSAKDLMAL